MTYNAFQELIKANHYETLFISITLLLITISHEILYYDSHFIVE